MKKEDKKETGTHVDDLEAFEEFEAPEELEKEEIHEIIEPETLEPEQSEEPRHKEELDVLDLAPDVPVQLIAVMAKKMITVRELLDFRIGHVIDLQRPPSEMVDLVANGKLIARGELVDIDGKLGVKVVKLVRS